MKKMCFSFCCLILLGGGLWAQNTTAKKPGQNAVYVDLGYTIAAAVSKGFGIGGGYERALSDKFSAMARFGVIKTRPDGTGETIDCLEWEISASGRFYPMESAVEMLYLSMGAGYAFVNMSGNNGSITSHLGIISVGAGYKFKMGHFFLEPEIGYTFEIGDIKPYPGADSRKIGGFKYGISLGAIF